MADNSKREQLLIKVKETLEDISSISYVDRKPLQGISELQSYPNTQIPLSVVLGNMPVPDEKYSNRSRKLDVVRSTLDINIITYIMDNETPDSTISSIADDIWAALYADVTQGFDWVLNTRLIPEVETAVWTPYAAFSIVAQIEYLHDKTGI
jgi:hypothetical protein